MTRKCLSDICRMGGSDLSVWYLPNIIYITNSSSGNVDDSAHMLLHFLWLKTLLKPGWITQSEYMARRCNCGWEELPCNRIVQSVCSRNRCRIWNFSETVTVAQPRTMEGSWLPFPSNALRVSLDKSIRQM